MGTCALESKGKGNEQHGIGLSSWYLVQNDAKQLDSFGSNNSIRLGLFNFETTDRLGLPLQLDST
jgi:hypothetical protein